MPVTGGRIVRTPKQDKPYKVVLDGDDSQEYPVATMREGEKLIREKSPPPGRIERFREWNTATADAGPD